MMRHDYGGKEWEVVKITLCSLRKSVDGDVINQYVDICKTVHFVIGHDSKFRFKHYGQR